LEHVPQRFFRRFTGGRVADQAAEHLRQRRPVARVGGRRFLPELFQGRLRHREITLIGQKRGGLPQPRPARAYAAKPRAGRANQSKAARV